MDDCNRNATDWELCVICQESNKEGLQCPTDSRRADIGAGYRTIADNLKQFADLGCMPKDISLSQLDEGDGIALYSSNIGPAVRKVAMFILTGQNSNELKNENLKSKTGR